MEEILLSWLAGMIFWWTYGVITILVSTFTLRTVAPNTWRWVKTGENTWRAPLYLLVILHFLFWPFIALCLIVGLILKHTIAPGVRSIMLHADKIVSALGVKSNDNGDEER